MRFVRPPADISAQYRVIRVGQKRLSLLILRKRGGPAGEPQAPGVLWIHGGGYLMGMAEMAYKSRAIDLVREGAVVVTPEYTLSWRAPYPQALRECHAALRWLKEHARELSVRTDQIMVGGESAGGGLAAALCMYEKDHGGVNIAFQMPLYPMIDCYDTDSSRDNHERVWNTRRNHIAWRVYLRGLPAKGRIPVYASPARRKDLRGLPPCYTFVGDIDPFYCETLQYVQRLKEAGIDARADVYEGFYHAYDRMEPETEGAKKAAAVFLEHFRKACRTCRVPQADLQSASGRPAGNASGEP